MSKDYTFNPGDFVVYPAHGVGQITNIEQTEVAGQKLDLIAVNFNKDKLTLRIPMPNAQKTGLRQIVTSATMDEAVRTLKGKAKIKRVQWGKRSQEYMSKINSGDVISVAEVLRDLYKDPEKAEQTYSERQIYEQAMHRLVSEYAVVKKVKEEDAMSKLESVLQTKNASLA
ncbi:MAG: CarD family transcriptional regulator [Alphaproteobacteria bacterium]|nr:CarD family transcriptional regulator [Alphaproteobacteria bacterium]